MAAAVAAAGSGHSVRLYEKNEKLGKKLFITGKGRCNVTNACDMEELFNGVVTNSKFLYSSFYGFTNRDMMELLERAGCPLKVERGNRVFPVSDKSSDVIRALEQQMRSLGVQVFLNTAVEGPVIAGGRCAGVRLRGKSPSPASDGAEGGKGTVVAADAVIIATGGLSYPTTGSTGDGHGWAAGTGHKVTEMSPALVPFTVKELEEVKELQGLSLKNIEAVVYNGSLEISPHLRLGEADTQRPAKCKELYREFGEMLFTHFGVSGPVLLSASSFAAKAIRKQPLTLEIDLKPALSGEQLDARILRDFEEFKNKQFKNALGHLFPSKLIPVMIRRSGISPEKQVNEITRQERENLVWAAKHFRLTLTGLREYKEAIITQGGVSVKDLNPSTMESRLVPGLYFAGEVLDLDAVTGGFNLQIAWSTGWAAGSKIEFLTGENDNGAF